MERGPLSDLLDALHELHLAGGYPSTRDLQRDIGGREAPSHAAIHKVFTGSKLPTWRLVEPLVQVMARRAGREEPTEVERIRVLWAYAARPESMASEPMETASAEAGSQRDGIDAAPLSRPVSMLLGDALDEIEAVATRRATGIYRIPTGFDDLEALLGGWSPGNLIVVLGKASSGKTTLLLHFCRAVSMRYRLPTLLITGEMNSSELQSRLLSAEARVPTHYLRTGHMDDKEWIRLASATKSISESPIHIATPPEFEMSQVEADAMRLAQTTGLKLLMVDSLQWVAETGPTEFIALRRLKKLAETAKIPIIITSNVETGRHHLSTQELMALLMEAIKQFADIVILLERPDQDEPETPRAGEADLRVVKNRNGPAATVTVGYQYHYSRFVDLAPAEE